MFNQQHTEYNREILLNLLKKELPVGNRKEDALKFIKWLEHSQDCDMFSAPLIIPGTQPHSVSEDGVSSYELGGLAQRGMAFYEAVLAIKEFDEFQGSLIAKNIQEDSILLCCLTYALDCTCRFKLNTVTGMYEDSADEFLLPPGIRRSTHIITRFFPLTTEELYAMALVQPGFVASLASQRSNKVEWFVEFCSQHPLSYICCQVHDIVLAKMQEKLKATATINS